MRNKERKIGSFMIGIGAIIELKDTGKILIAKRDTHEINHGTWEIPYGRIDHHEELTTALQREVMEETGLIDLNVKKLNRIWHIYRGEKHEDLEMYGFTFVCETAQKEPQLSEEHSEFQWISPEEALEMISIPGIKKELEIYISNKNSPTKMVITDLDNKILTL